MKYCELDLETQIVKTILPEYHNQLKGFHITQCYSKEFLDNCIIISDDTDVQPGDTYNRETQTFIRKKETMEDTLNGEN